MKEQKVLTMKDIAKEFGVSVATVSRALQDSSSLIPKALQAHIEASELYTLKNPDI